MLAGAYKLTYKSSKQNIAFIGFTINPTLTFSHILAIIQTKICTSDHLYTQISSKLHIPHNIDKKAKFTNPEKS